jgi:hypothetical protein
MAPIASIGSSLLLAVVVSAVASESPWVILPGREAEVLALLTPGGGTHRLTGVSIERDSIRASFEKGTPATKVEVVLRHPSSAGPGAVITRQFVLTALPPDGELLAALAAQLREREVGWRWAAAGGKGGGQGPPPTRLRWFDCDASDPRPACAEKLVARASSVAGSRPAAEVVAWIERAHGLLPADDVDPKVHLGMAETLARAGLVEPARLELDHADFAAERGGPEVLERWRPEITRAAAALPAATPGLPSLAVQLALALVGAGAIARWIIGRRAR